MYLGNTSVSNIVTASQSGLNLIVKPRLHDTTRFDNRLDVCLFTRCSRLSNQSDNRFGNRLYRVNGVLISLLVACLAACVLQCLISQAFEYVLCLVLSQPNP